MSATRFPSVGFAAGTATGLRTGLSFASTATRAKTETGA